MEIISIKKILIGYRLKELRIQFGYTLEQVGNAIGVSKKTVSKYEHDIIYPSLEKFLKLCILYKREPSFIFNEIIKTII